MKEDGGWGVGGRIVRRVKREEDEILVFGTTGEGDVEMWLAKVGGDGGKECNRV